jgi:predicted Rossmann-fold nucleotide-binding protein
VIALGNALAAANRPLVYGGGCKGIMGVISSSVREAGGQVTGVVPYAILAAGGEDLLVESSRATPDLLVGKNESGSVRGLFRLR